MTDAQPGPTRKQDTGPSPSAGTGSAPARDLSLLGGIGFALASSAAFGAIAPVAKIGYERGAEPLPLLGTRFSVAAILLLAILYGRLGARRLRAGRRLRRAGDPRGTAPAAGPGRAAGTTLGLPRALVFRLLLLGAAAFAAETWLFFTALELAPAGVVSLVFFSFPLITAVIAFSFKLEPARPRTFVALALGSAGVASIFGIAGTDLRGLLLALASAVAVAVYFVLAGILIRGVPPAVAAAWTASGAAVSLSLAAVLSGQALPRAAVPAGVGLGLLTTMAFVALYAAIARIGAPRAAVAQMFEPVVTVVLAAILLGEAITARVALGALLIVSALPVLSGVGRRRSTPPAPDSL